MDSASERTKLGRPAGLSEMQVAAGGASQRQLARMFGCPHRRTAYPRLRSSRSNTTQFSNPSASRRSMY